MHGPEDEAFDPDAVVWSRGVDYLGGWREARDAAAELSDVLAAVGVDAEGASATAQTRADGSGVVRLVWSAATVRAVARLVREAS